MSASQINLFSKRANKLKANHPSEDQIQSDFFYWLKLNEKQHPELKRFFAIPNGGFRHISTAIKMKETGTRKGVLDVFLPVPKPEQEVYGLWIEMKTETGRVSPEQKEWIAFLQSKKYEVHVCRSWHEAAQITNRYLGLNLKICPRG